MDTSRTPIRTPQKSNANGNKQSSCKKTESGWILPSIYPHRTQDSKGSTRPEVIPNQSQVQTSPQLLPLKHGHY